MVQPEAKLRNCRNQEALSSLKSLGFVGDHMVLQVIVVEFFWILYIAKIATNVCE